MADADAAKADLGPMRTLPAVLEGDHSLPFQRLSPDEFEIFCYLLLRSEYPEARTYYYGKTADGGRDVVLQREFGTELVQCKRYADTVGVGVVRSELAKVFVNIAANKIPTRPQRISFYVCSDLSAEAQDLLDCREKWLLVCESAITDYLRTTPTSEMLQLAKEWWPEFHRANGVELTFRSRKFPWLIDEFFSLRKVVDASLATQVLAQLGQMQDQLRMVTSPAISDVAAQMQRVVTDIQTANPEFYVDVSLRSNSLRFDLRSRDTGESHPVGDVSFPDTEAGRSGRDKSRTAAEKGLPFELEAGEFVWNWRIVWPSTSPPPATPTRLKATPRVPDKELPVRIDAAEGAVVAASLDFCYLRFIRVGIKEFEIELHSGRVAGSLRLSFRKDPDSCQLQFLPNLPAHRAEDALATVQLLCAFKPGISIRFTSLESQQQFLEVHSPTEATELIRSVCRFLENVVTINRALLLDLRYPESVSVSDARIAELVANAVRTGMATESVVGRYFLLEIDKATATDLIAQWKEGPLAIEHDWRESFTLLGQSLDVGPVTARILDAKPVGELDSWERKILSLAGEDRIGIPIHGSQIQRYFERWRKPTTTA